MSERRFRMLVTLLLAAGLASGCVYSKHITNEGVRELETSRIVVGETTVQDVLSAWGPPSPSKALGFLNPPGQKLFASDSGIFRYVSREQRCASFLAAGPVPNASKVKSAQLPFVWCDDQPVYVLLLEFDDAGVVKRISKGTTETVWRPWNRGGDRKAEVQTTAQRGMSLP